MGPQILRPKQGFHTNYPLAMTIFILALGAIYFFSSGLYLPVMMVLGAALVFSALDGGVVPMRRAIRVPLLVAGCTLAVSCMFFIFV